ncbi:MAG: hypothetical protein ABFR75_10245, partial [Acidobacteriota bacterium]
MERDKKNTKKEKNDSKSITDNEKTISYKDSDKFPGKTQEIFELSEKKGPDRGDSGEFPGI